LPIAGIEPFVELIADDARKHIEKINEIAFCFLDAEKEVYGEIYGLVIPRLVKGGILVADNAINHRTALQSMLEQALTDESVDALIVPIGKGVFPVSCSAKGTYRYVKMTHRRLRSFSKFITIYRYVPHGADRLRL
jgi:predicted O-methyltransferase YrrM